MYHQYLDCDIVNGPSWSNLLYNFQQLGTKVFRGTIQGRVDYERSLVIICWGKSGVHVSETVMEIAAVMIHRRCDCGHDDVIKWKQISCHLSFVRGIPRSPVNSPHKDQWRGDLMFTFICARTNGWVNNLDAGDLGHHGAHYDISVIYFKYRFYRTVDGCCRNTHYHDVIMTTLASQITGLTVVYSIVYSRKHQSSASLASVRGIHRGRWIPRTKGQ